MYNVINLHREEEHNSINITNTNIVDADEQSIDVIDTKISASIEGGFGSPVDSKGSTKIGSKRNANHLDKEEDACDDDDDNDDDDDDDDDVVVVVVDDDIMIMTTMMMMMLMVMMMVVNRMKVPHQ